MVDFDIHFGKKSEYGNYRLMELPKELLEMLETRLGSGSTPLSIRGLSDDDAVLCTLDKTYSVRAVTLSNAFCILTPTDYNENGEAVIRDSVQQIIEIAPAIPKLHRLATLLRGREYNDGSQDREGDQENKKVSLEDIKSQVQASDDELAAGLTAKHILLLNGELRPIAPSYLIAVLEHLLITIVALSLPFEKEIPAEDLADALSADHEVEVDVSMQVMSWFGHLDGWLGSGYPINQAKWTVDPPAIVKQLGLGVLSAYKEKPIAEDEFLAKWRNAVGDSFETHVDLGLLLGNYITSRPPLSQTQFISYFPSSELPTSPVDRFRDLFITQPRWRAGDILPFLSNISMDSKERDKLLLKYTRATTDKDGITWYTAKGGM